MLFNMNSLFQIFNKTTRLSLVLNILFFVTLVMVMNGLIFSQGWDKSSSMAAVKKPYIQPSGFFVASVWVGLITLMSYARWLLNSFESTKASFAKKLITSIIILCISYALYAIAVSGILGIYSGLVGNIVILLILLYAVWFNYKAGFKKINWLLYPVVGWLIFATTIIVSELT